MTCTLCKQEKEPTEFYPKNKHCKSCHKEKVRAWQSANRTKVREFQDRYSSKPENKRKKVQSALNWQANNPDKVAKYRLRSQVKLYGLTLDEYEEILAKQNGVCAICKLDCYRRLAVDHDHVSGKVRQLLCSNCNSLIGLARESKEILQEAINYLDSHNNQPIAPDS